MTTQHAQIDLKERLIETFVAKGFDHTGGLFALTFFNPSIDILVLISELEISYGGSDKKRKTRVRAKIYDRAKNSKGFCLTFCDLTAEKETEAIFNICNRFANILFKEHSGYYQK